MNEGIENLKELEKLELIIKKFKQLVTEKESEVAALKQQLHTERESLKKEADELMMKKIDHYEKELALVREDAQVEILHLEKLSNELRELLRETVKELSHAKDLNKSHQKLNGQLQVKLSKYEDKAAHYRRKAIL